MLGSGKIWNIGKRTINRFACFILLGILLIILSSSRNEDLGKDSLLRLLSEAKDAPAKIELLRKLSETVRQTPEELACLEELSKIAMEVDSIDVVYEALTSLGRYYTNRANRDSLIYYVSMIDSISAARKEVPTAVFAVHGYLCRSYLQYREYEQAMNEAVNLQILSEKENNKEGLINSHEYVGLLYFMTRRYQESSVEFETAVALLGEDDPYYKLQIYECQIRSYLILEEVDKAEALLADYLETLAKIEKSNTIRASKYPCSEVRCLIYSFYTQLYILKKDQEKALSAIRQAALNIEEISRFSKYIYDYSLGRYHYWQKEYKQALSFIDQIPGADFMRETLELKIAIYELLGQKEDAKACYFSLYDLIKQENTTAYIRQVDQIRSLQSINEQINQEEELKKQRLEIEHKRDLFRVLLVFLLVLIGLMAVLISYIKRTQRLRKALEAEKVELEETTYLLNVAKTKAEHADKIKRNFVANISFDIQTPLNAIVGFVRSLNGASEEERASHIQNISNNSDILVALVGNVLELSEVELDGLVMNHQDTNIRACCGDAIDRVRHLIKKEVSFEFLCNDDSLVLRVDPFRLQQLLGNLLTNAAQFTDEGFIHFECKIDRGEKLATFIVTDTGCGIPIDKQEVVFNRFEKVDESKGGVGLGLSICQAIAERFEGKIFIDPSYTTGARFVFEFPYANFCE